MAEELELRFSGLNLVCDDIEETVAFYRLLGVAIPEDKIWRTDSGPHHVERVMAGSDASLEMDSPHLARVYNQGYGARPEPNVVIGFRVSTREAVDEGYERLVAAGHGSRQAPHDTFWGGRYAIVTDPDGRDVGLMSPPDPALRRPPPDL